jgi:hypothetical protein
LVLKIAPAVQSRFEPFFARSKECKSTSLATRNDGNLGYWIILWHEGANKGMTSLYKFQSSITD